MGVATVDNELKDLQSLLHNLETKVQHQETDLTELESTMEEIRKIVVSLDKESAVKDEKLLNVIREVTSLNTQFEKLKDEVGAVSASKNNFMEKVVLTLIGSAIGALFSYISNS